jgi:mRNA interferase MazF
VKHSQGDVWWADLGEPRGSAPAFRRPVVTVQGDTFNRSRIGTVICVPLTSNMKWAAAPGNVIDDRAGRLPPEKLGLILRGICVVLGR